MTTHAPRSRTEIGIVIAVAIMASILGGALGYTWQRNVVRNANDRAAIAEARQQYLERKVVDLESKVRAFTTTTAAEPSDDTTSPDAPTKTPSKSTSEKQIGFITNISEEAGKYTLTIDYVEMLTGKAAQDAHIADGRGPIDGELFYLRNQNKRLRTFPVSSKVKVVMWTWNMESEGVKATSIPWGQFFDVMPGGVNPQDRFKSIPYWVTITDGAISKVEEQYLP